MRVLLQRFINQTLQLHACVPSRRNRNTSAQLPMILSPSQQSHNNHTRVHTQLLLWGVFFFFFLFLFFCFQVITTAMALKKPPRRSNSLGRGILWHLCLTKGNSCFCIRPVVLKHKPVQKSGASLKIPGWTCPGDTRQHTQAAAPACPCSRGSMSR